jgi:hypothetical protein
MKTNNCFVVQTVQAYEERGGAARTEIAILGVADTLEEGMQMLRDAGVREGRVLQIFPPRERADGKLVPCMPDIFPYTAAVKKPAKKLVRRAA